MIMPIMLALPLATAFLAPTLRVIHTPAKAIVMRAPESDLPPVEAIPKTAAEIYGEMDVTEAAEDIKKMKIPEIELPPIDIDGKQVEDVLLKTFAFGATAFSAALKFAEENQVAEKVVKAVGATASSAKAGFDAAVEFDKKNEVVLKAQAIAAMGLEKAKEAKGAKKVSMTKMPKMPE